jgi:hypothetical protein
MQLAAAAAETVAALQAIQVARRKPQAAGRKLVDTST